MSENVFLRNRRGSSPADERRNFTANFLVLAFFNLALSFVFPATVMTTYAATLTDSAMLVGLVPALFMVGMNLPQIVFARRAEHLSKKQPLVLKLAAFERLPYLLIGLSISLAPELHPRVALAILLMGLAVGSFSGGMLQPVWKSMLTKVVPPERRGRLFGLGFGVGGVLGIVGSLVVGVVLRNVDGPRAFGFLFLLSFAAHSVSFVLLALTREPVGAARPVEDAAVFRRGLAEVLRLDQNFTRYLASQVFTILGLMGIGFYVLYAQIRFPISESFVGDMTTASLVGISIGTPIMGWLADRWGNKLLGVLSVIISSTAVILLMTGQSPVLLYVVFACMNLGQNSANISRIAITMEFSSVDRVPTYTGLSGSLLAPFLLVAPLIAGAIIDGPGYNTLFLVILVCQALALAIIVPAVREPRRHGTMF